jgi:hypothetical protein
VAELPGDGVRVRARITGRLPEAESIEMMSRTPSLIGGSDGLAGSGGAGGGTGTFGGAEVDR